MSGIRTVPVLNEDIKKIFEAQQILDAAPVPTKGRLIYTDGVLYDCDTGKPVESKKEKP